MPSPVSPYDRFFKPAFPAIMNKQPQLVTTLTGEIFQPVRLYYRIHDMDKVSQIFGRLSCLEFDSANKRWAWLYNKEAKSSNAKIICI